MGGARGEMVAAAAAAAVQARDGLPLFIVVVAAAVSSICRVSAPNLISVLVGNIKVFLELLWPSACPLC